MNVSMLDPGLEGGADLVNYTALVTPGDFSVSVMAWAVGSYTPDTPHLRI